jgi:hypothetical protein
MDCGRTSGLGMTAVREPSSAVWGMWENEIQASTPESAGADSPPPAGDKCSEAHIFQPVQPRSARLVQSQISDESPHAWSGNAGFGQKANGEATRLPVSVAQYIHISALLAGTPESLALSDSASIVLMAVCIVPGIAWMEEPLTIALGTLQVRHQELVGRVRGTDI